MAEIKPYDTAYEIPESPVYDPIIRAIKNSDPINAETIVNPLIKQIITNVHSVKLSDDGKADKPIVSNVSLTVSSWAGNTAPFIQQISVNGIIKTNNSESLIYVIPVNETNNINTISDCNITATEISSNKIKFSANKKPSAPVSFIIVNAGSINGTGIVNIPVGSTNADTIDGKHATDFAPSGFGLGTNCKSVTGDWNNYLDTGFYSGSNLLNQPLPITSSNFYWYVFAIKHDSGWCMQMAFQFNSPKEIYVRNKTGQNWTIWSKISDGGDARLLNGHGNYVKSLNHNVSTSWNEKGGWSVKFNVDETNEVPVQYATLAKKLTNTLAVNEGGTGATDVVSALKNLNLLNNTFNTKPSCSALVYKDFSDFGLESMTMFRFAGLMSDYSSIIFHNYKNAETYITDAPTDEGIILFIRSSTNSRIALFFSTAGNSRGVNYQWSANSAVLLQNWTKINDGGNADTVDGKHATDLQNYNNLTNKPISLPANGGNADTVDGKHANEFATSTQITTINNTLNNKVDKVSGKDLSTNDFTAVYKTKLDGISTGAKPNVQSDWNITDTSSDAFIKNKPTSIQANGGNADTVGGKRVEDLQNYNNLTNKPISFPANGGNADTVDGKHANEFATASQVTTINNTLNNKVDKVAGKDLSTNDFTATYKTKLDGIQIVQSDWNVSDTNSNAFIQNKPQDLINKTELPTMCPKGFYRKYNNNNNFVSNSWYRIASTARWTGCGIFTLQICEPNYQIYENYIVFSVSTGITHGLTNRNPKISVVTNSFYNPFITKIRMTTDTGEYYRFLEVLTTKFTTAGIIEPSIELNFSGLGFKCLDNFEKVEVDSKYVLLEVNL